tara:strand:+ start:1982 stop:2182 length:201 start_codon:yes stop_codon:yes gene_type:complete
MRIFIYLLIVLSLIVIVYNATLLNFQDLFAEDNSLALIGIISAACVVVLLSILLTSKAIDRKSKGL